MSRSTRAEQIAVLRAAGRPVPQIAESVGIHERTVYKRLAEPETQALVQQLRRQALDQAVGRMSDLASEAVDTLAELMRSSEQDHVRLAAARSIIAQLLQVREQLDLEDRLAALEAAHAAAEQRPDLRRVS